MNEIILDIHHHGKVAPANAVTSFSPEDSLPEGQGFLSAGLHPWNYGSVSTTYVDDLERVISENPRIVAIGETGLDKLRGGDMAKQVEIFTAHVNLSEKLGLPLIIHSVRSTDRILQLHKGLRPRQKWAIHGFRGNPVEAQQLTSRGIYLSFGERFDERALVSTPSHLVLAETDESELPITEIISRLQPYISGEMIARNAAEFLTSGKASL